MITTCSHEALKKALIDEALTSLTQKPVHSTTIERIRLLHEADLLLRDQPQAVQYGKGVYYLLENCSLPIRENDLLLGRIVDKVLTDEEEAFFQSAKKDFGVRPSWIKDGGHRSFWWDGLLQHGLPGLKALAAAERERRKSSPEQDRIDFLDGMIWVYDAFLLYLSRYAAAAEQAGLNEAAAVCRELTLHAPQTFREALQLFWMVHLVYGSYIAFNCTLTLGRMDLLLEKLYQQDLAAGRLTADEARLLILDFYCKHNLVMGRGEHQMSTKDENNFTGWDRNACYDAPQYLLVGGRRDDGSCLEGELTHLLVEMIQPGFKNPVIEVRYAPGMQHKCPALWRAIVEKARANSTLMIYNEKDVISAFLKSGVDPEDAFHFEHYGCNHPTIPGMEAMCEYGHFVPLLSLLDILNNWVKEGYEPQLSDELYEQITAACRMQVSAIVERHAQYHAEHTQRADTWLEMTDCFYRYSIPAASSYRSFGSKYFFANLLIAQYASFVDAYTAVDELVIRQKKMTLAHLMKAVSANFEGYPAELAMCRKVPKLGSDESAVNENAARLMARFADDAYEMAAQRLSGCTKSCEGLDVPLMPKPLMRVSMESDNRHLMGLEMGATPDGRRAGVVLSQNASPAPGACVAGLTARLCSMASIPFDRIASGAQNLSISPRSFSGPEGLTNLAAIMGTFFDMGGLQLQITSVDPDMLVEAQKHPDQYRDLMVRITGYSAVFADMEKHAQDDIIRREVMAQ